MIQLDRVGRVVRGAGRPHHIAALAAVLLSACVALDGTEGEDGAEQDASVGDELTTTERIEPASPGAGGIGDPLYPTLGNGGYDVEHYDLDLRYATAAPHQAIDGTAQVWARATQSLSQLNLDFRGDAVGSVRIDGRPAAFKVDGEDLVIAPPRPIRRGQRFVITVSHFVTSPRPPGAADVLDAPFFIDTDGSAWAAQPNGAHWIFPSNDHPADKASFSFRIDVPAGTTAVANGVQTAVQTRHGRTVYQFEQCEPMATELAQVVVGEFTVIPRGKHAGTIVRDVVPTRLVRQLGPKLAGVTAQLSWLEQRLGAYPFASYGSLVVASPLGFALETQTLSVYDATFFDEAPAFYEPVMVHELAHQWFGNSVAPERWSDIWQSEGHATWYQLSSQSAPDAPDFVATMQTIYSLGDVWRTVLGPVAGPRSGALSDVFNPNVYYGGALVLYALRQQVGDATFRQIERAWVAKYRGQSASTADFIALSSRIAKRELKPFLTAWLNGATTPPMPGHPGWTVDAVDPNARLASPRDVALKGLRVLRH